MIFKIQFKRWSEKLSTNHIKMIGKLKKERKVKIKEKSDTDCFKDIEIIKWEVEVLEVEKEYRLEVKKRAERRRILLEASMGTVLDTGQSGAEEGVRDVEGQGT